MSNVLDFKSFLNENTTIEEREILVDKNYILFDVMFNKPVLFNATLRVVKTTKHKQYGMVILDTDYQPLKDRIYELVEIGDINNNKSMSFQYARDLLFSYDFIKFDGYINIHDKESIERNLSIVPDKWLQLYYYNH